MCRFQKTSLLTNPSPEEDVFLQMSAATKLLFPFVAGTERPYARWSKVFVLCVMFDLALVEAPREAPKWVLCGSPKEIQEIN